MKNSLTPPIRPIFDQKIEEIRVASTDRDNFTCRREVAIALSTSQREHHPMASLIDRISVPNHLFSIPELDFSDDLFTEPLIGPWFRLGTLTINIGRNERDVEDYVKRRSLLIDPEDFAEISNESISVISNLGEPCGSLSGKGVHKRYRYTPFYRFELSAVIAEPLVFVRSTMQGEELFINPDLLLCLKLEEKEPNSGVWWDLPKGTEAVRHRVIEQVNLEIVDIRVEYLCRYLQARQMTLAVGHLRYRDLYNPSQSAIDKFIEGELSLGSLEQGAKAVVRNNARLSDIGGRDPFLQRTLGLWIQIPPPAIDLEDPWAVQPPFDPYEFTLPTRVGPVAPARWAHFRKSPGRKFDGEVSDFMELVCFRQEVLTRYEGTSGFSVVDDGSVYCYDEWALNRNIQRLGNELLTTGIGDFHVGKVHRDL